MMIIGVDYHPTELSADCIFNGVGELCAKLCRKSEVNQGLWAGGAGKVLCFQEMQIGQDIAHSSGGNCHCSGRRTRFNRYTNLMFDACRPPLVNPSRTGKE